HGSTAPRARKAKKASPSTSTLRSAASARRRATVDFPAPGGPVTTRSEPMRASVPTVAPPPATSAQGAGSGRHELHGLVEHHRHGPLVGAGHDGPDEAGEPPVVADRQRQRHPALRHQAEGLGGQVPRPGLEADPAGAAVGAGSRIARAHSSGAASVAAGASAVNRSTWSASPRVVSAPTEPGTSSTLTTPGTPPMPPPYGPGAACAARAGGVRPRLTGRRW